MQLIQLDAKTLCLSNLEPFTCELLKLIVPSAKSDDPLVRERLFSSPSAGTEPRFDRDWREYVEPDLRHIFASALEVVEGDLAAMFAEEDEAGHRAVDEAGGEQGGGGDAPGLKIPLAHLEAWIHGLNQARLALSAHHGFAEAELEQMGLPAGENARALALIQMNVYGVLMEWFLQVLDSE